MKARNAAAATLALAGGYLALLVGARRWQQHWGASHERSSGRCTCGCSWSQPTSSWAAASSSVSETEPKSPAGQPDRGAGHARTGGCEKRRRVLIDWPRFVTASLSRRWHLRWGATDAEVASAMPGDELVPHRSFTATRAITVAAPPEDVWPWILQLGTGRAGWYSYDLFDNAARPSADRILPQFQAIRTGDWVPMPIRSYSLRAAVL
jgi:hypothetical protein